MNTLTTNIVQNVYNIGTNACNAGTQYCSDGYALYFPCLKSITKGQDTCFDFYIADSSTHDVIDLRDVDAISLNLAGQYNCTYGTFSYPDNISSLQVEEYPVQYMISPEDKKLCHLKVYLMDVENDGSDAYDNFQESDFYSNTEVEVAAYDTPTHIFLGWAILNFDDEDCPDDSIYDDIVCSDNVYKFTITEDTILLALYRPRKVYSVISHPDNENLHFNVIYENIEYHISNRPDEVFDDGYNVLGNVLEGYHMVIKCIPSTDVIGNGEDQTYVFNKWADGSTSRCRIVAVGDVFVDDDVIKLKASCTGPVPYYELEDEDIVYLDEFDEDGIHINTIFSDVEIFDYYGGENVIYTNEVYQKYIDGDGFLYFNNGNLIISSSDIEDGVKVIIHAKCEEPCDINVKINDDTLSQSILTDEFRSYEYYFSKCDKSDIEIDVDGECLIDRIEVCKEEFVDKGKAQLCLDAETTSNLPSGQLSVNGAIMVDGKSYGIATVQIGEVNKLPKITLNING